MVNKRGIIFIIIIFILLGLGIYESITVEHIITSLSEDVSNIEQDFKATPDDISQYSEYILSTKDHWSGHISALSLMFNHKDLSIITDTLNRLYMYSSQNQYEDSLAELSVLIEYSKKNRSIMGFNYQNVL